MPFPDDNGASLAGSSSISGVSEYDECMSVPASTLLGEYSPCSLVDVH